MTDIALLPCPFCGRKAELHTNQIAEDAAIAFVMCSACFAATDNLEDAYAPTGEAIAAWNRRASPSQVAAANPAQGVEQTWQKPGKEPHKEPLRMSNQARPATSPIRRRGLARRNFPQPKHMLID